MQAKDFLEKFRQIIDEQYPLDAKFEGIISSDKQKEHLASLKKGIAYEQFFFVINLENRKIENAHGLEDWLGIRSSQFDLYKYFSIIHPSHFLSLIHLANSSFHIANSGAYNLSFMSHRVIIQIPLKHTNGTYHLYKRTLYPFQIDKSGKVLSYLNHFVLLREYVEDDSLAARVSLNTRVVSENEHKSVLNDKLNRIAKYEELPFNERYLKFLKLKADKPELTNKELALLCGVSETTVSKSWNVRINKIAKEFFQKEHFGDGDKIKHLAIFMRNEGLI